MPKPHYADQNIENVDSIVEMDFRIVEISIILNCDLRNIHRPSLAVSQSLNESHAAHHSKHRRCCRRTG